MNNGKNLFSSLVASQMSQIFYFVLQFLRTFSANEETVLGVSCKTTGIDHIHLEKYYIVQYSYSTVQLQYSYSTLKIVSLPCKCDT